MHEVPFLANPMVWYTASVILFLVPVFVYGWRPLMRYLDGEIAKVHIELDRAKRLRAEAEASVHHYEEFQKQAQKEAARIIENAHREADVIRAQAAEDLKHFLADYELRAKERIQQAELTAINDIRVQAVEFAMAAARKALAANLDSTVDAEIIDAAIAGAPRLKTSGTKNP